MSFLAQVVVNAIALFLLDHLMSGVTVVTGSGQGQAAVGSTNGVITTVLVYLVVGLILALITAFIKPVLKLLALPFYILTLGLFGLVVDGFILILVSKLTPVLGFGLQLASFGTAVLAAIVLAILTALISIPFRKREQATD
jgi:putative membrane protein